MTEKRYNNINNALGWVMFAVAAVTYLCTLEPTASFWDCPEYIAQSYGVEVGHPPGNPFFVLTARFFANFAPSPDKVAVCINAMSALLSAATILLLFWTITHMARRLLCGVGKAVESRRQMALIMGSGICGALAFTWSDTFWFSAVEAEVYAYSSFCTALTFWLVLKWESRINEPHSDRWLVAIAYVVGVSIGVHLLNLLCVPAIALVVYYRKVERTHWWTTFPVLVLSLAIIMFILYGLVPGSLHLAQYAELLFVNQLGLSFNNGALIYAGTFLTVAVWTIYELYAQRSVVRMKISFLLLIALSGVLMIAGENLYIPAALMVLAIGYFFGYCNKLPVRTMSNIALYIVAILTGFGCYAVVPIRSCANVPMNVNAPDNVFALESYIERDQFGSAPLFYGTVYTANSDLIQRDKNGKPITKIKKHRYSKRTKSSPNEPDSYIELSPIRETKYAPEVYMFLPRIYAPACAEDYSSWVGGITPKEIVAHVQHGDSVKDVKALMPSYWDNVKYFAIYQFSQMYWRYMLFNFVGRQNDINGNGEVTQGNWLSGIPLVDNLRLGDQKLLPKEYGEDNEGHNLYYGMPFLLGILGLLWQARCGREGKRQAWVLFLLWFMTGVAIVLYLNQTPGQCRERDYSFAGSFYAYAVWIGLGVIGLYRLLFKAYRRLFRNGHRRFERIAFYTGIAAGVLVPLQMVSQTWDDHDRTGRSFCHDYGRDLLISTDKNAILFNSGDNLSFPLWYTQDVEGFRTDARTLNTDYLNGEWYIRSSCHPYFDSERIALTGTTDFYSYNTHRGNTLIGDTAVDAIEALKAYYDKNSATYGKINALLTVDANAGALLKQGKFPADCAPLASSKITVDLRKNPFKPTPNTAVNATTMVMADMIATNAQKGWPRNIAYVKCMSANKYSLVAPYLAQTGLTVELTPFRQDSYASVGTGYSDRAYDNFMHRFGWGGIDKATPEKRPYLDEVNRSMITYTRLAMLDLADRLMLEGDVAKEASENASIYPLLPKRVRTAAYAADRYAKARDILVQKETKLPECACLSNYEFYQRSADLYYRLWRATGNEADHRKADQLITAAIDRFAQHMIYFQTLTFWQPMANGNRLVYNDGGFLRLLASYANGSKDEAMKKIAEVERRGVDIWAAFERTLNIVRGKEPPAVGNARVWKYTYEAARTLKAYNPKKYAEVLKKNPSYGIAVDKAEAYHDKCERDSKQRLNTIEI